MKVVSRVNYLDGKMVDEMEQELVGMKVVMMDLKWAVE